MSSLKRKSDALATQGGQTLDKKFLENLSREIGHEWTTLAVNLGIKQADIEYFETHNPRDRASKMLLTWWRQQKDNPEAPGRLKRALTDSGRTDLAMTIPVQCVSGGQTISDKFLLHLSKNIGRDFHGLATNLGFSLSEIETFQANHPHNLQEQVRRMLVAWGRQGENNPGAIEQLRKALSDLGRNDLAVRVPDSFCAASSHSKDSTRTNPSNFPRTHSAAGTDTTDAAATGSTCAGDANPSNAFTNMDVVGTSIARDRGDKPRYKDGRGYVLFINNFVKHSDHGDLRKGAEKDTQNIKTLFDKDLKNYECVVKEDLTKSALHEVLDNTKKELAAGGFTRLILIMGSHGKQIVEEKQDNRGNKTKLTAELIETVDGKYITEEDLTAPFMGDQLKEFEGKPKVFIVQACRSPPAVSDEDRREHRLGSIEYEDSAPKVSLPVNADVLISYATSKGTSAWRYEVKGSLYIYHLCDIIKNGYKEEHLMDLLMRVNDEVARKEINKERTKQMPCQVSTLTKHIWLT